MQPVLTVSQFVGIMNDTLEATLSTVDVTGEVVSANRWNNRLMFFEMKDSQALVRCMIPLSSLEMPIEQGMQVQVSAVPRLTKKGVFSLNVRRVRPVGEGSMAKAFAALRAVLEREGLFAVERKRPLPSYPRRVGLVTSLESAAYHDFLQIASQRWGGMEIVAVHTQVQGEASPEQIVAAIDHVNRLAQPVDILVVTRGGGSTEDLMAFNTESVVRAVADARVPTVVGIGHERDEVLAELAADERASTPTDAARRITPDRHDLERAVSRYHSSIRKRMNGLVADRQKALRTTLLRLREQPAVDSYRHRLRQLVHSLVEGQQRQFSRYSERLQALERILGTLDPQAALRRGYAVVRYQRAIVSHVGALSVGDEVMIQLASGSMNAKVIGINHDKKAD